MHSPSVDLSCCDHATFDAHYLRTFAMRLPSFFRPSLDESPFTVKDVVGVIDTKLFAADRPLPAPERVMRDSRLVRTHISYIVADEMLCAHTGQREREKSFEQLDYQLMRTMRDKIMIIGFPTHPLHDHYKAEQRMSKADTPIKVIKVNHTDQQIATWVREYPLEKLIEERMPELLTLDPHCRVILYAHRVRAEMRAIFARGETLTMTMRERLCDRVFREWVDMIPHGKLSRTAELEAELGTNLDTDNLADTILRIAEVCKKNETSFRRYLPLMEEVLLKQAMDGDATDQSAIEELCFLLKKYNRAVCDFPSLGIAQLAYKIRFAEARDVMSSL